VTPHWALWFAEHGVAAAPLVFVGPSYPAAVNHQLMCAKFGNRFVKWFCTGHGGSRAYRALSTTLQTLVRFADSQLIEEQSGEGLPRYRLLVNPMSAPWTSGRS
jgi:hypothetical protein